MAVGWFGCILCLSSGSDVFAHEAPQSNAHAKPPVRLFADVRLRYERVADDLFEENATALTARVRLGIEAPVVEKTSVLLEFEGIGALADGFDDAVGDPENRPVVTDADIGELNRFQLTTTAIPHTQVVLGRQRIALDDERFIGRVAFRQNEQTYDAVRVSTDPIGPVVIDAAYIRRTNRILSRRSPFGRFNGDSYTVNVAAPTPIGQISVFHYALDLAVSNDTGEADTASSRTSGVRVEGRNHWDEIALRWEGSYARQTEFADAPVEYSAIYWLAGLTVDIGPASAGFRTEVLGGGEAQPFQTPLGTLHKFQGKADVFLTTPDTGIRDHAVALDWRFGDVWRFKNIQAKARYHWFDADAGDDRLGEEFDFGLAAKFRGATISAEYADYRADAFAADISRLWLTVERKF